MKNNTFVIEKDAVGRKFVCQNVDEMDKNHRETNSSMATEGRMYEKACKLFLGLFLHS